MLALHVMARENRAAMARTLIVVMTFVFVVMALFVGMRTQFIKNPEITPSKSVCTSSDEWLIAMTWRWHHDDGDGGKRCRIQFEKTYMMKPLSFFLVTFLLEGAVHGWSQYQPASRRDVFKGAIVAGSTSLVLAPYPISCGCTTDSSRTGKATTRPCPCQVPTWSLGWRNSSMWNCHHEWYRTQTSRSNWRWWRNDWMYQDTVASPRIHGL